ncbi:EAL domain-containing protein [Alteromonas pelagimontana]|uniref:EAL domain-containing protein n=1 Tax=Alteromonas pelagimontana TaxID=1858656 RepID=A0A6M4MDK8_9ALTE|nr:EAL domain-containing protein [Alteromonas pelagimontana]QJR81192.1 EAL domain-containing protein [Alteromonas pelagimontana]
MATISEVAMASSGELPLFLLKRHVGTVKKYWALAATSLLIIFLMSFASTANSAPLVVDDSFQQVSLHKYGRRTLAPANESYANVFQQQSTFSPGVPFARIPENNRLWQVTTIQNAGAFAHNLFLKIDKLSLDAVSVFVLDEQQRIIRSYTTQSAFASDIEHDSHLALTFPFDIQPGQQLTLMTSIDDDGITGFPLSVWSQQALEKSRQQLLMLYGTAIGALTVLFGSFFITYLFHRTPARFWLALTCLLFVALIAGIQGETARFTLLPQFAEHVVAILCAMILFTLSKLNHNLFNRLPLHVRLLNFLSPVAILAVVALNDAYIITVTTFAIILAAGLLQIFFALIYRDRRIKELTHVFLFAWLCMYSLLALQLNMIADGSLFSARHNLYSVVSLMVALLSFGLCVGIKERNYNAQQISEKERTITGLNYFYNLFRNSAEGLYTSTIDGKLRSVNPAMCNLFGYPDEATMLASVPNAQSFYANPEDRELLIGELLEKGCAMGREIKGIRADNSEFWFSISCQLQKEQDDTFMYGSIFDITDRKQSEISLEYLASHDSLTGVYNRREFEQRLNLALNHPKDVNVPVVILYLDLDRFKTVNDTCGHRAGDTLIKEIAQHLQATLGGKGIIARLGGDEFAVLFSDQSEETAYLCGVKLLNTVQKYRFMWENRMFTLGVSIGFANSYDYNINAEQLISMADAACYIAKQQGRNQIHRYSSDDKDLIRYEKELDWVNTINQGLLEDKFLLYYQHYRPLNKAIDGDYYEILLRLENSNGDVVPPSAFLPTAERYNLSAKIDRWVVENTLKWLSLNPDSLATLMRCNINLSGHSLADRELKLYILNAFEKYGVAYEKICFEITESMAIIKMENTLSFISTFQQLGCQFALDDFGSGFSSYSYLKHLPVSCVKIDGSFIKDMLHDPVDMVMVSSINDVAKAIGMTTVAEFVEDDATLTLLGKMGIDFAQGYGVAKPHPLNDFKPL